MSNDADLVMIESDELERLQKRLEEARKNIEMLLAYAEDCVYDLIDHGSAKHELENNPTFKMARKWLEEKT